VIIAQPRLSNKLILHNDQGCQYTSKSAWLTLRFFLGKGSLFQLLQAAFAVTDFQPLNHILPWFGCCFGILHDIF